MDQRHDHLGSALLVLVLFLPVVVCAVPRGLRVDDSSTATPNAAVLTSIDLTTGKGTELLNVKAESLGRPVVIDGTLFVTSSAKVLYALDPKTGKKKWEHKSDEFLFGLAASPKAVFVGAGGNLKALDARNGTPLWSYTSDIPVIEPILADGLVVFNAFDGPIAVEQNTGKARWRLDLQWGYFVFSPLPEGRLSIWKPDETYVIDTDSGKTLWQSDAEVGMAAPGYVPTAAVGSGNLICKLSGSPNNALDWSMHAYDAGSGHVLWKTALGEHRTVGARTLIAADCVFCVLNPEVNCLDAATGQLKWKAKINPLEAGGAGMLADKASLYIPELGGDLVALDIKTGQPRWRNSAPKPTEKGTIRVGGVFVSDSAIYITRIDQTRP